MTAAPPGGSTPPGIQVVRITAPPPIDKVSVLGVAASAVFPPAALVLGIAGLVRTRNGVRSGRWAAVVATVVGSVATVVVVGAVGLVVWLEHNDLGVDEARRGTCVNLDEGVDGVQLRERDCTEAHDGEVVFRGDFTSSWIADYQALNTAEFCAQAMADLPEPEVYGPDFVLGTIVDSVSAERPLVGDAFICVLERVDGEPLTQPLTYHGAT